MIGHKKYVCAQSEANIYRAALMIFLYEELFPQTRLFAEHGLAPSGELLQEEFSAKMGPIKPNKSYNG